MLKSLLRKTGFAAFKLVCLMLASTFLWVLFYRWVPVPHTPYMLVQENPVRHKWVPIEIISKDLQLAVICSEDQRFLEHFGFDVHAIKKAIKANRQNDRVRGASSISQQTAKNVFLWPSRSWIRKGFEVYFTFLIELLWSKERILEVYLNSIEMGKGVFGAHAAAQHWYGVPAGQLDARQSASIAAVLPSPKRYVANPPSEYIHTRIEWILGQMRMHQGLPEGKDE